MQIHALSYTPTVPAYRHDTGTVSIAGIVVENPRGPGKTWLINQHTPYDQQSLMVVVISTDDMGSPIAYLEPARIYPRGIPGNYRILRSKGMPGTGIAQIGADEHLSEQLPAILGYRAPSTLQIRDKAARTITATSPDYNPVLLTQSINGQFDDVDQHFVTVAGVKSYTPLVGKFNHLFPGVDECDRRCPLMIAIIDIGPAGLRTARLEPVDLIKTSDSYIQSSRRCL
ncbi:hypothetical protein [Nocardia sp. CNY236]|uniref:hypothetical protein n=1 Tax=Nocardia sp. CNY236 TaxID=1169152 RepID=UPI00040F628C|nr:hypothetical protein [Nocardia sp. CNY236]